MTSYENEIVQEKKNIDNIVIFTDGSYMKKKTETLAGIGVYFPNGELVNISKKFTVEPITNQRTELYAIYKGIKIIAKNFKFKNIMIYSDSEYSIKSLTIWIDNWKKNSWKSANGKDVLNQDIIKKIDKYLVKYKGKIKFQHVRAHTGKNDDLSKWNDEADKLAKSGALE
jgi:ribonuclease HI